MADFKITVAGQDYEVEPLTLRQIKSLMGALATIRGTVDGNAPELLEAGVQIIAAALSKKHPEMTADAVLDTSATLDEVNEAVGIVLKAAGLAQAKDGAPGEAAPVAA